MNLKQLNQFIALAETGNFHRAAEQLHMAQPPLSISIRKLEEELGSALFDRTSTGVVLTPAGKAMLERDLSRLALAAVDFAKLAEKCNLKTVEDMYAALGAGDLRLAHAVNLAQQQVEPERGNEQLELIPRRASAPRPGKRGDIQIQGVGNLLTQMAGCCQPLPGDPIVGYITVGRGVSIHRQDCASVLQLEGREPERIIQVSWGPVPVQTYPVDIVIKAYDRSGLLRDVTQVLLNERINVLAVNTRSNKEDNTASMQLTIEIPGLDALSRLLARISQLPNIIEARRNRSGN